MTDPNILIGGVSLVGVVMALTQIAKQYVASKFAPIVAVILGIGLTVIAKGGFSIEVLMMGLVVGLSACGLYSGGKAVISN